MRETRATCQILVARATRANRFAIETHIFIARQADSHESLEFPIRVNRVIRTTTGGEGVWVREVGTICPFGAFSPCFIASFGPI